MTDASCFQLYVQQSAHCLQSQFSCQDERSWSVHLLDLLRLRYFHQVLRLHPLEFQLVSVRYGTFRTPPVLKNMNYQTYASTSPPTACFRASLSESTPFDVDTIAIPKPLSTRGTSSAFA